MSESKITFDGIPPEFQSLFKGSARDVISEAQKMIDEASVEDQQGLLENEIFCKAVRHALFDLDQRSRDAGINFVSNFDKENQPLAHKIFLGDSN